MIVNYTNWFSLFTMPRTLINAFETMLFTIALFYMKKSEFIEKYKL